MIFYLTRIIVCIISLPLIIATTDDKLSNCQVKTLRATKLPACQACRMLVNTFTMELEKTFKGPLKNLIINKNKETLNKDILKEIFSNMCREDGVKDQCRTLVNKCKFDLQNWWMYDQAQAPDLLDYLCIAKLRYCCPNGHYGPDCSPCPGYPDRVCNNNGKCKGNGTRKGNGQCSCDVGYSGTQCDECAATYYVSYKDYSNMLCARCHVSCDGNCSQAGPQGCHTCRDGWKMDKTKGCVDVNECFFKRSPCKRNEFCVNNDGSYSCLVCDPACDTCTGDGPDMCDKCSQGYLLKDNICVNEKTYIAYSDITRYLTYGGLCFATYIIFQNSPWTASIIGICVAVYVTVSEYMLGTITQINFVSLSKTLEGLERLWR